MKRVLTLLLIALLCTPTFAKRHTITPEERVEIVEKADRHLAGESYSVTYKKATTPSGDKRDYISMGPYWWADPSKPDGLPYIRRDGEVNPECRENYTDFQNLKGVIAAVRDLRIAYFATNNNLYARRAEELLRIFFVDNETKMNPNLNYGQFVPGHNSGRCFGIIELSGIPSLLEDLTALERDKVWDKTLTSQMHSWMSDMLEWLLNSQIGTEERNTLNNHATHYDRLCVAIYIYIGEPKSAREYITKYTLPRLPQQIAKDGSQPKELARTKSWNYSTMNLKGFIEIAQLGEQVGYDLWHYSKGEHIYIKSMIDWFVPYLNGEREWTWRQIHKTKVENIRPIMEIAAEVYKDGSYLELNKKLKDVSDKIVVD